MRTNRLLPLLLILAACGAEDPGQPAPEADPSEQSPAPSGKADNAEAPGAEPKFTGELAWLEPFCAEDDLFGAVYAKCYPGVEMMARTLGQRRPGAQKRFYYPASEMFDLPSPVDDGQHVRVVYCLHDTGCELPEEYIEVIVPEHWALVYDEYNDAWSIILKEDFHIQQYDPESNTVVSGTVSTEPYRGGDNQGFFWVLYNIETSG